MRNFFHVALNTFRESLREPVYFLLLCSAIVLIGLFPSLALFVFREQQKFVIDSAMATTLSFGLIIAVLCAASTITREIKNGTVLLMMSKPISRYSFIFAKTAGVLAALTIFVILCSLATILSVQVAGDQFKIDFFTTYAYYAIIFIASGIGAFRNFYSKKSFPESSVFAISIFLPTFILLIQFIPISNKLLPFPKELIPALILLLFAVWTMGAITVTLSTKLDLVANLSVSCFIFCLGLVSDYFFAASAGTISIKAGLYAIIPNWQFFWLADALANKTPIPWEYIAFSALYVILYLVICGVISVSMFLDREVAA